jgi:adenosylhomocysteine nucleosidase
MGEKARKLALSVLGKREFIGFYSFFGIGLDWNARLLFFQGDGKGLRTERTFNVQRSIVGGQFMLGIITAVTAERDAALQKMVNPHARQIYGIEFYEGTIGRISCVLAMAGIGKVNAARCVQLMIDQFQPDRIVNIGSAGALHPEVKIGDVIISTACIQHDLDLTAFGLPKGYISETEGLFTADPELRRLCEQAMGRTIDDRFRVYAGLIVTGDQFNDSVARKEQLYREFGAYCIEMEGAAVAQVCAMCRVPFVIIRSISDQPGEDTMELYENYKDLASRRCADFVVNLMELLN